MAVNPNISLSLDKIQLPDPLEAYGKYQNALSMRNQNELTSQTKSNTNALNEAYRQSVDPNTGQLNLNNLRRIMAGQGIGSAIPGVEKSTYEAQKANYGQQQASTEAVDAALKQSREFLSTIDPNDPNAANMYIQWHEANHTDPTLGPVLAKRGITAEQSRAQIQDAISRGPEAFKELLNRSALGMQKFQEMNKPNQTVVDRGGSNSVLQTPGLGGTPVEVGQYADVPLPDDVAAQKVQLAESGASNTNINMNAENKYGETVAKAAAEEDMATYKSVQALPIALAKMDEVLSILETEDVNTGLGAEVFNILDKARGKYANDKKAGRRVESTEYLDSLLGSDVFPLISELGIGSRGLDTKAEKDFLRQVITGSIKLDKDTLIRLTNLRKRGMERKVQDFNNRVEDGEFDNLSKASGRAIKKIDIKSRPITAVNPETGQSIISNDGGNTWINSETGEPFQ